MSWIRARRPAGTAAVRDAGMSLVELVVAMLVLGIMASAVLGIVVKAQSASVNNRSRVAAANLAAREIDIVRDEFGRSTQAPTDIANAGTVVNPHQLPGGVAGQPLRVDGTSYTVTRSVRWSVAGTGKSACDGGSLVKYPTLDVDVSVTWGSMGRVAPVEASTQLAPPKGAGVPENASFVAVGVVDSTGAPSAGRGVRVASSSETRTGTTDESGCAVVQVNPPSGSGAAYTAQLTDTGYVDVNNATTPSKSVGTVLQGQLNNSVSFAYDRASTLRLTVVDSTGTQVPDSVTAGTSVTITSVGSTGATASTSRTLAGSVTTLTGLWPTTYGAYYGAQPPAGGYRTVRLAPGASSDLSVTLDYARGSVVGGPPGATTFTVAPGAGPCTASGAKTVDPSAFALMPGAYSFFASGPAFDCAPGPSSQVLASGDNDGVVWEPTTLQVTGAPATGVLWAVSATRVTGTLTTCPAASLAGYAINVDAARSGPVALPAGSWYLFRAATTADSACLGTPLGQYPKAVPYPGATTLAWSEPVPNPTLTGTGFTSGRYMIVTTATSAPSCGTSTYTSSGTSYSAGPATSGGSLTVTVPRPTSGSATYAAYVWNKAWPGSCTGMGKFVVGTSTTALSKASNSTSTVGP